MLLRMCWFVLFVFDAFGACGLLCVVVIIYFCVLFVGVLCVVFAVFGCVLACLFLLR